MKIIGKNKASNSVFSDVFHSKWFENTITIVIILAGIIVGLQTSKGITTNYGFLLDLIDHIIIGIFVIEIILGLLSENPRPWRYFYDAWHIFDFIIVAVCLLPFFFPESNTQFFAVFRLARILRLAKIFEKIKSLKILLTSLLKSIPSMGYVIILLVLLFYIYGVIATDLFGKYYPEQYGSIWGSMKTLLIVSFEGISGAIDDEIFLEKVGVQYPEWIIILFFTSFLLIAAVIFLNLFIGIITSDIQTTKEDENRGKSKVNMKNHTVILGWNASIFKIIQELIEANESSERAYIVILAEMEKSEMDNLINDIIANTKTTIIKCRSGNASVLADLELTNYKCAKSIILLQDENKSNPDISILKTIIALISSEIDCNHHIVAEMNDKDIINKVKSISNDVIIFEKDLIVSKLIAQSALQPYLSNVHSEITGFDGSEFYIANNRINKSLVGLTYKEILFRFHNCCPVGYVLGEDTILNPKPDTIFQDNYELIILAEDDSTIKLSSKSLLPSKQHNHKIHKNTLDINEILILGSNDKINDILLEIDSYLNTTLIITIATQYNDDISHIIEFIENQAFKNLKINFKEGDIDGKNFLYQLTKNVQSVILLSYYGHNSDVQIADAISLVSLIHLRELAKSEDRNYHIVAEIIDDANRELVNNPKVSDFIISSQIASSIIAQYSEEKSLYKIFNTLLTSEGGEIYLRNALNYVDINDNYSFADIINICIENNETAIGFIQMMNDDYNVVVNPNKDDKVNFKKDDKLIVISEEI